MSNGYVDVMWVFNKVLKPSFSYLIEQGLFSVVYVNDTLLGTDTFEECQDNVYTQRSPFLLRHKISYF